MPASTFQSESFQKMLVIGVQAKDLHLLFIKNYYKVREKTSERGYCIPLSLQAWKRYLEKLNVS